MILLFFSVWAIAIALGEVMFSAQPFSLDSIMSTLPHTMIFSALLSAAVYLAKSKIIDAIHKGRPIDKKFVAEITPEVGHELNKMRKTIASYDEQGENWRDLDNPDHEFKGQDYAIAQELFAKLSAASAQGQINPDAPELKELIAKAKEAGLDIQDLMAMAESQDMPIFPDLNLPENNTFNQPPERTDTAQAYEVPLSTFEQSEPIDAATLAAKEQNIAELVDKYRSQGHVPPHDTEKSSNSLASLERLAAQPELKTSTSTRTKDSTPSKTLGSGEVQPIRSINIKEREKQLSLQHSRRSAKLDALAEVVNNEDKLISKFRTAAAEGNQLAKAKSQASSTAPAPRCVTKDRAQVKPANVRTAPRPQVTAPTAQVKTSVPPVATTNDMVGMSGGNTTATTPKAQFEVEFAQPQQKPETILESSARPAPNFTKPLIELEPQDQVLNVYDVQERTPASPAEHYMSTPKTPNEGQGHERIIVDNPSLVDTSKLKKYQYVPPKKGAGLDTSALKKVTLPNYNRSGSGPSRLGAASMVATTPLRPAKKTVASTASLSVEARQEIMARRRKSNQGSDQSRMGQQSEQRKANWQSTQRTDSSRLNALNSVGTTPRANPNLKPQSDFVLKSASQQSSGSNADES